MRKFLSLLFFAFWVLACSSAPAQRIVSPEENAVAVISSLRAYTVELVRPVISIKIDDNDDVTMTPVMRMFCSGVWVGPDTILTAGHCARLGGQFYRTYPDAEALAYTMGRVDMTHDLALLKVDINKAPAHPVAKLAADSPPIGAYVHLMGHPGQLLWTYYRGYVAAYRPEKYDQLSIKGPWLQIQAPIIGGSSGSGAYDSDGRLVGLCSRGAGEIDVAFYVHLTSIRNFLVGN